MAKSLLRRLTPQDLQTIRDVVAYDPTTPNGLRWLVKRKWRRSSEIGRTFWIGQFSYQASQIVMILNGKLPVDGDCIVTRIDKDGSWGDVDNLMWAPKGSQVAGGRDRNRRKLLQAVFGDAVPDLSEGLRLASLCKRGHEWNGHPVTLQSRQGNVWRCLDCVRENHASPAAVAIRRAWYQKNIEQLRQKARERMAALRADPLLAAQIEARRNTPEVKTKRDEYKRSYRRKLREQGLTSRGLPVINPLMQATLLQDTETRQLKIAICNAGRMPSVAALVMREQRRYWRANPEAKAEHNRQWAQSSWWLKYQTRPDLRLYHREKSKRRKAQNRGQTSVQLSPRAIRMRFNLFGNLCAYCGATGDMELEHVVAISQGGAHDISNIVPACKRCNTSKRAQPMEQWYRAQPFFSEIKLRCILKHTGDLTAQQMQLALA